MPAPRQKKTLKLALTPLGYDLLKCYARYILVVGPRKCGKTLDCMNRIIRHAVEAPGLPEIAFVGDTLKNMKASGTWKDLTQWAIPIWVEAGLTEWVKYPKTTPDTKMTYCQITNNQGKPVELQLHSLDYEDDVERKFKSNKWSMIYLPECDQFKQRKTFTILSECLRRRQYGVPDEHHHMLLDCNPPEEAEDHFLFDEFVAMRDAEGKEMSDEYKQARRVFRYFLDNNIYLTDEEKQRIKDNHAYDSVLYARMVEGKWVKAARKGHFKEVLLPNVHFVGNCQSPDENEWEYIEPPVGCYELFCSWDIGDSNSAIVFMDSRREEDRSEYDVFDEIIILHEPISVKTLTQRVIEKMRWWEKRLLERDGTKNIKWHHFSDISSFRHRGISGSSEALTVTAESGGEIVLDGVAKEWGSVYDGIVMIKRMLHERRLFISAKCPYMQDVIRNAAPGEHWKPGQTSGMIRLGSDEKHGLDALRYALQRIEPREIVERMAPEVRSAPVMVRL